VSGIVLSGRPPKSGRFPQPPQRQGHVAWEPTTGVTRTPLIAKPSGQFNVELNSSLMPVAVNLLDCTIGGALPGRWPTSGKLGNVMFERPDTREVNARRKIGSLKNSRWFRLPEVGFRQIGNINGRKGTLPGGKIEGGS